MLLLRAEDLESQGISCQSVSEFVFHNTTFKKGQSFPKSNRQAAIESCNRYLRANVICLVIETQAKLTLWAANSELNQVEEVSVKSSDASRYDNTLGKRDTHPKTGLVHQTNLNSAQKPVQPRSHKFAVNHKTVKPATP